MSFQPPPSPVPVLGLSPLLRAIGGVLFWDGPPFCPHCPIAPPAAAPAAIAAQPAPYTYGAPIIPSNHYPCAPTLAAAPASTTRVARAPRFPCAPHAPHVVRASTGYLP